MILLLKIGGGTPGFGPLKKGESTLRRSKGEKQIKKKMEVWGTSKKKNLNIAKKICGQPPNLKTDFLPVARTKKKGKKTLNMVSK